MNFPLLYLPHSDREISPQYRDPPSPASDLPDHLVQPTRTLLSRLREIWSGLVKEVAGSRNNLSRGTTISSSQMVQEQMVVG